MAGGVASIDVSGLPPQSVEWIAKLVQLCRDRHSFDLQASVNQGGFRTFRVSHDLVITGRRERDGAAGE